MGNANAAILNRGVARNLNRPVEQGTTVQYLRSSAPTFWIPHRARILFVKTTTLDSLPTASIDFIPLPANKDCIFH
jgi:hypothetical protein